MSRTIRAAFGALLALGTTLAALASTPAQAEVVRRALIVGHNDGGLDLEPLQYAEADARKMARTLIDLGGFASEDVVVLESPSVGELSQWLDAFAEASGNEDEELFFFYYSGHADAAGLRLGQGQYRFETLRDDIERVDAEVRLGVLDACQSGAITKTKGAKVVDPFLGNTLTSTGEVWITASSADERAQESDRLGGSFFTHHLITGLRGAADDGDGVVSLSEAYSYAYESTVTSTDGTLAGTQHPEYNYQLSGQGDLPLTRLTHNDARVTMKPGFGGHILILARPSNQLVAELHKVHDEQMVLALPPGRYLLRRRDGDLIYEMELKLSGNLDFRIDDRWGQGVLEVASAKGTIVDDTIPVGAMVGWQESVEVVAPMTPGEKLDDFLVKRSEQRLSFFEWAEQQRDHNEVARAAVAERMDVVRAEYDALGEVATVRSLNAHRRQIREELRASADVLAVKGERVPEPAPNDAEGPAE